MVTGVALAVLTVFANVLVTQRARLIGVGVLTVPQFYFPGIPVELATVAVVWTMCTCVLGLSRGRSSKVNPLLVIMGFFIALTAISLVWAAPAALDSGAAFVVRSLLFLLWLREVIVVSRDDPSLLDTIVLWAAPGVAVQAVLSIVFRIAPDVEYRFLTSEFAALLVGPQATNLYTHLTNNVWYDAKSGGLFVNGNVGSLFGGIAGLLLIVAARRTGLRWPYPVAVLSLTGALFTGSKTAVLVLAACTVAIIFLPRMLRGWVVVAGIPVAISLPLVAQVGIDILQQVASTFFAHSPERALASRQPMWNGAAELFSESPFLGLGFGGWSEQMVRFTSRPDLPPHNFIIATWANSGLLAAVAAVIFMFAVIGLASRVAAAQSTLYDRRTGVIALSTVAWVFLHGMADNTTVYGEQRTMIIFALAIGYLYAMDRGNSDDSESDNRTDKRPDITGISQHAGVPRRSAKLHYSQSPARRRPSGI